MFERFTDRARRVVVLAQEEARLLGHNYIGTEHILLGLIHEQEGVAARVLDRLGISLEAVRAKVESIIGEGGGAPTGHIPFTPRSKKVLELSLREALQLGHNYIGTEHILLGLIREGEGVGAQVLTNLGADLSRVRHEVIQQLSGFRGTLAGSVGGPGMRARETPAAAKAGVEARRLAGSGPVGSQHYLLGLLLDQDSVAARALTDLGLTRELLEAKVAELETTGTSDETPEEAGARRIGMRVEGQLVTLELDDPELAFALEQAMAGRKVRIIKGTDPEAVGFPGLWASLSRTIEDLTRRLAFRGTVGEARLTPRPAPYWRPPMVRPGGQPGEYSIMNRASGPEASLDVGPDVDREALRAWLGEFLVSRQASGEWPVGGLETEDCVAFWLSIDVAGDSFRVASFGVSPAGPPDTMPVPLADLVAAAIDNLSAAT